MKEKANYPNTKKNKNKIYHFLAFRRKAKTCGPSAWSTLANGISNSCVQSVSIERLHHKRGSSLILFCFIQFREIPNSKVLKQIFRVVKEELFACQLFSLRRCKTSLLHRALHFNTIFLFSWKSFIWHYFFLHVKSDKESGGNSLTRLAMLSNKSFQEKKIQNLEGNCLGAYKQEEEYFRRHRKTL